MWLKNIADKEKNKHEQKWYDKYQRLIDWKQKHPHPWDWPKREGEEAELASWMGAQRKAYKDFVSGEKKSGRVITQEQVDLLGRIGFIWDVHEFQWQENYQKLVVWKDTHPDPWDWPKWEGEEAELASWMGTQRKAYKDFVSDEKKSGRVLTQEQVGLLKSIGFIWDVHEFQWQENYQKLVVWKDTHPDPWDWPKREGEEAELASWIKTQRKAYKDFVSGEKKSGRVITQEQVDLLKNIDFIWDVHQTKWQENYQKLVVWKDTHPDPWDWPKREGEEAELASWMGNQRTAYKDFVSGEKKASSVITQEQVDLLESIKFPWNARNIESNNSSKESNNPRAHYPRGGYADKTNSLIEQIQYPQYNHYACSSPLTKFITSPKQSRAEDNAKIKTPNNTQEVTELTRDPIIGGVGYLVGSFIDTELLFALGLVDSAETPLSIYPAGTNEHNGTLAGKLERLALYAQNKIKDPALARHTALLLQRILELYALDETVLELTSQNHEKLINTFHFGHYYIIKFLAAAYAGDKINLSPLIKLLGGNLNFYYQNPDVLISEENHKVLQLLADELVLLLKYSQASQTMADLVQDYLAAFFSKEVSLEEYLASFPERAAWLDTMHELWQ